MRARFLGVVCVCAIVACTDGIALPTGTADLAFEGSGTDTVAWGVARPVGTGYAGWSLFFSANGSAATSCNDDSYDAEVDLWIGSAATSSPTPLPAGEYHVVDPSIGCGSGALCSSMELTGDSIDWAEIELVESDATHLRGSLMGSAASDAGSGTSIAFYGSFDALVCAP